MSKIDQNRSAPRNAILLNRSIPIPLRHQLEAAFREAIASGVIAPGEKIMSSRELQSHLGVSRNTVTEALSQLHAQGYLVTVRGKGTFVAPQVAARPESSPATLASPIVPTQRAAQYVAVHDLARNDPAPMAFRPGIPDLDLFPFNQFKASFNSNDWARLSLDYPVSFGYAPLREAIAERVRFTRGVACSPDQILITSGAQAACALILSVLLNKHDPIAFEEPGYPNIRALLHAHEARIVPASVDEHGIDVDRLRRRDVKVAYVTPSHQYPTGVVLSLDRRLALLDWASRNEGWIIEDDYDSEFNYTGRAEPALQGLDENGRVIYVGSFSKVLSPALRIGYMVVPHSLKPAFHAVQAITGSSPSIFVEAALARFIEGGHLKRHIAKMRKIYDQRRQFAAAELARDMEAVFRVRDTASGLHFIVEFPPELNDAEFSARAAARGITVNPLSGYYVGAPKLNGVVVGYAATPIEKSGPAIEIMKSCAREMLDR